MNEESKPLTKKCPVCAKEYADEDNYCGDDGSRLEQDQALQGKQHSAGAPLASDDPNLKSDSALQH